MPIHKQSKPAREAVEEQLSASVLASMQLALGQPAPRHHFPLVPIDPDLSLIHI